MKLLKTKHMIDKLMCQEGRCSEFSNNRIESKVKKMTQKSLW